MLKNIRYKYKLNKRPIKNSSTIVKNIDQLDENILLELLASQYASEGVFGIEQFSTNKFNELYFFTPSIKRIEIGREYLSDFDWSNSNNKNLHCYKINFAKPTFLPIYTNTEISILNDLKLLSNNNVDIFFQLLFTKRVDKWRNKLTDQYENFLQGNDAPSQYKFKRKIQSKILKIFEKLEGENFKRESINVIENKILDEGYRTEIRLILICNNKGKIIKIEDELKMLLKDYDYFNELELRKILKGGKKAFLKDIDNRKFSNGSQDQIFSFAELESILLSNTIIKSAQPYKSKPKEAAYQSSSNKLIKLLPIKQKEERKIDYTIIDDITNSMKRVGIIKDQSVNVNKIQQGSTLQKITIDIPKGINYSDIEKNYKNLKATLGYDSFTIEQGDEPNTISFIIPCNEREIIYLKELLNNKKFLQFADENILPFIIGVNMIGNPLFNCLTNMPHLIISGTTGSGKSVWLNTLIITLLILRKPNELILYLIDPNKVELSQFNGFPHVQDVITDLEKANAVFASLVTEMERRYDLLAENGYRNIKQYNKNNPNNKIPYIVCIVDEFADLKIQHPDVEEYIERMGAKARASGIHLVIATQYPKAEIISTTITANMPSAISFRLKKNRDYQTIFGSGIPYTLLGDGDGVAKIEGQIKEFERFQGAVISLDDNEEMKVYENIKNEYNNENIDNGIEIKEPKKPLDQLKMLIATTRETRISVLRKEMKMRQNDVSDLMKQLVDEGWVEKIKNKYHLIADEEILNKWKI